MPAFRLHQSGFPFSISWPEATVRRSETGQGEGKENEAPLEARSDGPTKGDRRRAGADRRKRPTPMLSRYMFRGRRKTIRRSEDRNVHLYVDQYNLGLFLFILSILLLGVADAYLTLYHVNVHEAEELNPIMGFFLGISPTVFFHVKYILTSFCLLILCLHKNLPVVRYLLGLVFGIYLIIVLHHIYLLAMVS